MLEPNEILKRLLQHRVEFVLVGGLAAVAYGVSTMTQDIDVCCAFDAENMQKVLAALDGLHPAVRAGSGIVPLERYSIDRLVTLRNLYLKTDWGEVDLLGTVAGLGNYRAVETQAVTIDLFGFPCRILHIDALIRAKQSMGRPKDQQVVHELQVIRDKWHP